MIINNVISAEYSGGSDTISLSPGFTIKVRDSLYITQGISHYFPSVSYNEEQGLEWFHVTKGADSITVTIEPNYYNKKLSGQLDIHYNNGEIVTYSVLSRNLDAHEVGYLGYTADPKKWNSKANDIIDFGFIPSYTITRIIYQVSGIPIGYFNRMNADEGVDFYHINPDGTQINLPINTFLSLETTDILKVRDYNGLFTFCIQLKVLQTSSVNITYKNGFNTAVSAGLLLQAFSVNPSYLIDHSGNTQSITIYGAEDYYIPPSFSLNWKSADYKHEGSAYPQRYSAYINGDKINVTLGETKLTDFRTDGKVNYAGVGVLTVTHVSTNSSIDIKIYQTGIGLSLNLLNLVDSVAYARKVSETTTSVTFENETNVDSIQISNIESPQYDVVATLSPKENSWIKTYSITSNFPTSTGELINERSMRFNAAGRYSESSTGTTVSKTFTITQEGPAAYFKVSPENITVPASGGNYIITVDTNLSNFSIAESLNYGWSLTKVEQVGTIHKYKIVVSQEYFYKQNVGYITFSPPGFFNKRVTITQEKPEPFLRYTPELKRVGIEGEEYLITLETNLENGWSVNYNIASGHSKQDLSTDKTFDRYIHTSKIIAAKNTSSVDKVSSIIASSTSLSLTTEHKLIQSSEAVFDILNDTKEDQLRVVRSASEETTFTAVVHSNISWTATVSHPWIHTQSNLSESGSNLRDTNLTFTIDKNENEARAATIVFTSNRGDVISILIYQEGGILPSIEVTPKETIVDNSEHIIMLEVKSTHSWYLSQISRYVLPDWITIDTFSGDAGISKVTIKIAKTILERSIDLIFSLADYDISDTATIIQTGLNNGYDITDIEDESDWSDRKEAKIRDKYCKVKIRYTGNDLAIITALKTLYETSYA